jgi:hypothetical protein
MRLIVIAVLWLSVPALAQDEPKTAAPQPKAETPAPAPGETPPPSKETLAKNAHAAIRRGLDFLHKTQTADGAWGSHDPVVVDSAQLGFGILDAGSHDGVRTACTSICAKAILGYPRRTKEDMAMLDKALDHVLKHLRLAYDPGNAFNCWGYAFNLDFLITLYRHEAGKPYHDKLKESIPVLIEGLKKMQAAEGGWAYYTSVMMEGSSISFISASILLSLLEAKEAGFEVPNGMIEDAGKILKTMRLPNRSYIYGTYLQYNGQHHLEELSSGGRTQVCGLAQHRFDGSVTREDLMDRSKDYFQNIDYVEKIGNKRIIPHRDAPQNISGYFLYYGAYYASWVMTYLGKDARETDWTHLAEMILRNQEGEGSWWDTICFDYGDKWGTGFAIQCLEAYLEHAGS